MIYAGLGVLCTPLDIFFQIFEKKHNKTAIAPKKPQIFVCGAPRAGTTLTAQVLIRHLPVFYFNNLTSIFPRSPITASKLFGWVVKGDNEDVGYTSFYGRTTRPSSPNDALYFWDRWTGGNRHHIPEKILPKEIENMVQFFGAMEAYSGKPLVAKNNSLNTYADLVAQEMEQAYFICLDRDPLYLAQSHIIARRFIQGNENIHYGIGKPEDFGFEGEDYIEDLCRQILFYKKCMKEQQRLIGRDRFYIVKYEDFCQNPVKWVHIIAKNILGITLSKEQLKQDMPTFIPSMQQRLDDLTFNRIKTALAKLEVSD